MALQPMTRRGSGARDRVQQRLQGGGGSPGAGLSQQIADALAASRVAETEAADAQTQQTAQRLQQLRDQYTMNRSRTAGELAGDVGLDLLGGAVGIGEAAYGLGNIATLGYLDRATGGFSENFDRTQQAIQGWQSDPMQASRRASQEAFDEGTWAGIKQTATDPRMLGSIGAQAGVSVLPPVAAGGAAARVVGGIGSRALAQQAATRASIGAGGAQMAGNTNVDIVNTMREQGVEPGLESQLQATGASVAAGIGGAAISRLTGAGAIEGAVGRRLAGIGATGQPVNMARGFVAGSGREMGEEAAQETLQTVAVNALAPDNTLFEGAGQAAAMGAIGGALIGGPLGAYGAGPARPDAPQTPQTPDVGRAAPSADPELLNLLGQTNQAYGQRTIPLTTGDDVLRGTPYPSALQNVSGDAGALGIGALNSQLPGELSQLPETLERPGQRFLDSVANAETQTRQQRLSPEAINQRLGIDRGPGLSEGSFMSLNEQEQQAEGRRVSEARARKMEELFNVEQDAEGNPVFSRWNRDFQRFETVDPNDAVDMADAEIAAEVEQERRDMAQAVVAEVEAAEIAGRPPRPTSELIDQILGIDREQGAAGTEFPGLAELYEEQERAAAQDILQRVETQLAERATDQQAVIDQTTGVSRETTGLTEEQVERDLFAAELFDDVTIGDDGQPVYWRFNEDNTDAQQVPRGEATREINARVKAEREVREERQRPIPERWKDALVDRLGVNKAALTGREWDAFALAADMTDIQPEDPQADQFLQDMTDILAADEANPNLGKLAQALGEQIGVREQAAAPTPAAPAAAEQQAAPAAEPEVEVPATPPARTMRKPDDTPFDSRKQANNNKRNQRARDLATANGIEPKDLRVVEVAPDQFELQVPPSEADTESTQDVPLSERPTDTETAAKVVPEVEDQLAAQVELLEASTRAYMAQKRINNESKGAEKFFNDNILTMNDLDALDESFTAFKNTRYYREMEDGQKTRIAESANDKMNAIDGPARLMRVDPQDNAVVDYRTMAQQVQEGETLETRAPKDKSRKVEKKIEKRQETPLTPERRVQMLEGTGITAHETVEDYRVTTGRRAPSDTGGVFDDDGIHVILSNIKTEEHLAEVILHERAHQGLRQLLGDRLAAVTNRLWANAALRERIKAKMRNQSLDRGRAAEEVLVDMVSTNNRLTGDVWSKLRSGISSAFESVLGVGSYRVTDRQVDALLDDVSRVMRGDSVTARNGGLTAETMTLDSLIGEPTYVLSDPRFSRARDAMNNTVALETPAAGNYNQLSAAVKEATEVSRFKLKDAAKALRDGRFGRAMAYFMPLNQQVNMWKHRFQQQDGTNPMIQYQNLVDLQEASFNQTLSHEREYTLDGDTFKTSPLKQAEELNKLQRTNPNVIETLNKVNHNATKFQVWPQKSWEDQPAINYEREGFTADQRRAAYDEVARDYKSMGKSAQDHFKSMQAFYKHIWATQLTELENLLKRHSSDGQLPTDNPTLMLARRALQGGPYSPLQRHGKHLVVVRDHTGAVVFSDAFDTASEAEQKTALVGQRYRNEDGYTVIRNDAAAQNFEAQGLNQTMLQELQESLASAIPEGTDPDVAATIRDTITETYLKLLPAHSFGQFSNRRMNVDSLGSDSVRAYSDYALKASRRISSLKYDDQITQQLLRMDQQIRRMTGAEGIEEGTEGQNVDVTVERQVVDHLKSQRSAAMQRNFNQIASMLAGAGFMYMMTSPSQLFVNASQTALVAMPRLAARYGMGNTLSSSKEALRNFAKARGNFHSEAAVEAGAIDRAGFDIMQMLYEHGVLDFTFAGDMTDTANGESGQLSAGWRTTMKVASSFIHKSEVFNRQITAYMAYKMEIAKNGWDANSLTESQKEQLGQVAKQAVYDTQFNYSQSNKPVALQGPMKRLIFQFQQYRLNMLATMARDIRDATGAGGVSQEQKVYARKALAYMLGTQLALTGVVGTALAPIAFALMDALGSDDEDFLDSRTAFIEEVPTLFAHGLIGGALGLDPSRMETGSVLPILGDRTYAPVTDRPAETYSYYLERNIGPWWGLITGGMKGLNSAANGDFYEATQGLLPKPMADIFRAGKEWDGVRNKQGVITYDTGGWDTLTRAVGLRSVDAMEAQNTLGAGYQVTKRIEMGRRNILVELAYAHATGNNEDYSSAMSRLSRWNEKNPEFPIGSSDIARVIRSQAQSQMNVETTGMPLSRRMTPGFLDAASQ